MWNLTAGLTFKIIEVSCQLIGKVLGLMIQGVILMIAKIFNSDFGESKGYESHRVKELLENQTGENLHELLMMGHTFNPDRESREQYAKRRRAVLGMVETLIESDLRESKGEFTEEQLAKYDLSAPKIADAA